MRVCVVGAGLAGLSAAVMLARAGHEVTVLDRRGAAGQGASFANGSQLSYSYVAPFAAPGVAFKAAKWVVDAEAPLRLKPQADRRQWLWLHAFLRCCTQQRFERTTEELLTLGHYSAGQLNALRQEEGLEFGWRRNGKLVVYRDAGELAGAANQVQLQARFGAEQQVLDASGCLKLEPALEGLRATMLGGVFTPSEEVGDAHRFCLELERVLTTRYGGTMRDGVSVTGLDVTGGTCHGVRTDKGPIPADAVVLAAGTAGARLLEPLGLSVPIYPLKGYSLTVPVGPQHLAPEVSITDSHHKVVYALLRDGAAARMRVAGMVDLVGEDESLWPARIALLRRQAAESFPGAADWPRAEEWSGLRPAAPDSKPFIGGSGIPGLWLHLGHGALGFTLCCGTARMLLDLMEGRAPAVAADPFALGRRWSAEGGVA